MIADPEEKKDVAYQSPAFKKSSFRKSLQQDHHPVESNTQCEENVQQEAVSDEKHTIVSLLES